MTKRFGASLHIEGKPGTTRVQVEFGRTGLTIVEPRELLSDKMAPQYRLCSVSRGGFNNNMLLIAWLANGTQYCLYFDSSRIAKELRRLPIPSDFLHKIEAAYGRVYRIKRALLRIGVAIVVVGLIYVGIINGMRLLADGIVHYIPHETEADIGKAGAIQTLREIRQCTSPDLLGAVNKITERLLKSVGQTPYTFRFRVLELGDINAFALPGGYIMIYKGLLDEADTPDEVAAVLAHEIQHVLKRHGMRNVIARAGVGLMLALLFSGGGADTIVRIASELGGLSFSRVQEAEADRLGLELLYRAGFDPEAMPRFFEKLAAKEKEMGMKIPSFLSDHPATMERIQALRKQIEQLPPSTVTPLEIDWEKGKWECKPVSITDPDKDPNSAAQQ